MFYIEWPGWPGTGPPGGPGPVGTVCETFIAPAPPVPPERPEFSPATYYPSTRNVIEYFSGFRMLVKAVPAK